MIDGIKEFSDIALQSIALASVIFTHCTKHVRNFLDAFVGTFVDAARIRIVDKCRLEYFIQNGKSGVVKHPISDNSLMYPSDLRIMYPKSLVWPMPIRFILQVAVQVENIMFNIQLKLCNVRLVPFIRLEYLPSSE
jgi:hypothetical protein